jgi:hypothetical protein
MIRAPQNVHTSTDSVYGKRIRLGIAACPVYKHL